MSFDRDRAKQVLADLANMGVFIGTSFWKPLVFVNNRLEGNVLNTIAAMVAPEG